MSAPGDKGGPKPPPRPATIVRGSKPPPPPSADGAKAAPDAAAAATMVPTETRPSDAPDDLLLLAEGAMVGEYRIDNRLGEGGMATVYAATHPLIGKRAAIKVMTPQLSADTNAVERFVQEARAVNQIGHPNIIDVFAFGTLPDGRSYFVMELLPGETLHARMASEPLKLRESIAILFDVCDALEAAHEKGIVHRDLKPENIFLVKLRANRMQVKLLDFGVAKLNNATDARATRTRQDTIIGTPHYLSPEQARAKPVDARTDVYSLGVMAFEMITGKVPFDGDNVMDILVHHMNTVPPKPSSLRGGLPRALDEILMRMLAKAQDARPTLDEVRAALGEARDAIAAAGEGFNGPMEDSDRHAVSAIPRATPRVGSEDPAAPAVDAIAAVEPEALLRSPRSRLPLVLGLVAVASVGLGVIWFSGGTTAPPAAKPTPPPASPAVVPPKLDTPPAVVAPAKSTLKIVVDAPDATIEVDENIVAEHSSTATVSFGLPGSHVVVARAAGRKPANKIISLTEGETFELKLSLAKSSAGKPKTTQKNGDYMLDPFGKH